MKESQIRITYNNYVVISVKKLDKIIFVKTYDKTSGEIFWFLGFDTKRDLISDVKRALIEDKKYSNMFFKQIFQEDYYFPPTKHLIIDDAKIVHKEIKGTELCNEHF